MDKSQLVRRITGCYIPIPTLFHDGNLDLNLAGMQRHVRFLLEGGVQDGNGAILVGGGAGEFGAMNVDERLKCAAAAVEAANGKVGIILGVQTTNQRDLIALARGAEKLGCIGVQASAPFYEIPTEDDVIEWLKAISDHADIGIVFYATPWTGFHSSIDFVGRLTEAPGVFALKWYSPNRHVFELAMRTYAKQLMFIDNSLNYVFSHMMGAGGINLHVSNYWPQWGLKFWDMMQAGQYAAAQETQTRVVCPYYDLCHEVAKFTGGEGHLDKLCLELIGLDGGRCRPPTRDIRQAYRVKVRQMLLDCGAPGVS